MKGIYILFSGGYDSTYLVHNVLENIKKGKDDYNKDNIELNLISVVASFSPNKTDREKMARDRLLQYWKAKYFDIKIVDLELKIDVSKFSLNVYKTGLSQPHFWISSLMASIDYYKYEEINLLFSYICGDQALVYRHELETICNATYKMSISESSELPFYIINKPKLNVLFPLMIKYKEDILTKLILNDKFLFDNSTSCESADKKDLCGNCTPCRCLRTALANIINDKNTVSDVEQICKNKLKEFEVEKVKEIKEN